MTVKLGVGGFSMGAATALYSATCYAQAKYGNNSPYPVNLKAVVGLSGWLPGSRYDFIQHIPSQAKPIYAPSLMIPNNFVASGWFKII